MAGSTIAYLTGCCGLFFLTKNVWLLYNQKFFNLSGPADGHLLKWKSTPGFGGDLNNFSMKGWWIFSLHSWQSLRWRPRAESTCSPRTLPPASWDLQAILEAIVCVSSGWGWTSKPSPPHWISHRWVQGEVGSSRPFRDLLSSWTQPQEQVPTTWPRTVTLGSKVCNLGPSRKSIEKQEFEWKWFLWEVILRSKEASGRMKQMEKP